MKNSDDENGVMMLEKAVYHAKDALEKTKNFKPFYMLLNSADAVEFYEAEVENLLEGYSLLEERLKARMEEGNVEIVVLVVDTQIPDKFAKEISIGIRIHIEEKSQIEKRIAAKFIYVPYELCRAGDEGEMFVKLHTPHSVGFPAEYIVKN